MIVIQVESQERKANSMLRIQISLAGTKKASLIIYSFHSKISQYPDTSHRGVSH